jgi:hypothetical protein
VIFACPEGLDDDARLTWAQENRPDLCRTPEQVREERARRHEPRLVASSEVLSLVPQTADPVGHLLAHSPEALTVYHPQDLDPDALAAWAAEHAPGVASFQPDHRRIHRRRS